MSMTTLAKIARVHVSTVSRALRGEPTIPEATRLRLRDLAAKLGYRPDPALAALCAYRKSRSSRRYQATLAVLATSADWSTNLANQLYFEGARQRAEQLGYKTEVFVLAPGHLATTRLVSILQARAIRGMVVLPLADVRRPVDLPWNEFSVVALGYKLEAPGISRVSVSHFEGMQNALQHIRDLGYRRPGLVLRRESPQLAPAGFTHVGQIWEGGYQTEVARLFPRVRIPVLHLDSALALARWRARHRPDVIISQDRDIAHAFPATAPQPPCVFTMVDDDPRLTGIHQNSEHVGRHAIDTLIGAMHRHEAGSPPVPITILVQTCWQAGTTAGRVTSAVQ